MSARSWDNSQSYATGDYVYSDGKYYRALRPVSPPFLPSLMEGDAPGKSDAWREVLPQEAYGQTVLGMFDIADAQRNMNDLKAPLPVAVAQALLKGGQAAISGALAGAKQPWYKSDLPGDTSRKTVQGHLQWHADKLASTKGDPLTTNYDPVSDLEQWTMRAFVEANAVEEGAAYIDGAWNSMWDEIQTKLAAIPRAVAQAAGSVAKGIVKTAAQGAAEGIGVPTWVFVTGGAALVGLVGYFYIRRRR
jgi:hypothetical protein